jgi:hypothetical protein
LKKTLSSLGIVAALVVGSGVVLASSGTPSIAAVSASYKLELAAKPTDLDICTGANGHTYVTESVKWAGTQTDTSSTPGPYSLSGFLVVTATATFDNVTGAGVARGTTTLYTDSTLSTTVYKGPLLLNSQVVDPSTKASVARGSLNVPFYTGGTPNGSKLVGNQELTISGPGQTPPLEVIGSFGSPTGGIPDLASEYNEVTC